MSAIYLHNLWRLWYKAHHAIASEPQVSPLLTSLRVPGLLASDWAGARSEGDHWRRRRHTIMETQWHGGREGAWSLGLIITEAAGTIDLNWIEQLEVTWARVTLSPLDVRPPPPRVICRSQSLVTILLLDLVTGRERGVMGPLGRRTFDCSKLGYYLGYSLLLPH